MGAGDDVLRLKQKGITVSNTPRPPSDPQGKPSTCSTDATGRDEGGHGGRRPEAHSSWTRTDALKSQGGKENHAQSLLWNLRTVTLRKAGSTKDGGGGSGRRGREPLLAPCSGEPFSGM